MKLGNAFFQECMTILHGFVRRIVLSWFIYHLAFPIVCASSNTIPELEFKSPEQRSYNLLRSEDGQDKRIAQVKFYAALLPTTTKFSAGS